MDYNPHWRYHCFVVMVNSSLCTDHCCCIIGHCGMVVHLLIFLSTGIFLFSQIQHVIDNVINRHRLLWLDLMCILHKIHDAFGLASYNILNIVLSLVLPSSLSGLYYESRLWENLLTHTQQSFFLRNVLL